MFFHPLLWLFLLCWLVLCSFVLIGCHFPLSFLSPLSWTFCSFCVAISTPSRVVFLFFPFFLLLRAVLHFDCLTEHRHLHPPSRSRISSCLPPCPRVFATSALLLPCPSCSLAASAPLLPCYPCSLFPESPHLRFPPLLFATHITRTKTQTEKEVFTCLRAPVSPPGCGVPLT